MARKKVTQVTVKQVNSKSVSHNFEGLRDALFEELNLLRANLIPVARARTTANIAKRIIEGATLELVHRKMIEANGGEDLKRLLSDT